MLTPKQCYVICEQYKQSLNLKSSEVSMQFTNVNNSLYIFTKKLLNVNVMKFYYYISFITLGEFLLFLK